MDYSYIDKNISHIKNTIDQSAKSSGRDGRDVLLMVAVKSADVGEINYLHNTLGINRS